MNLITKLIKIRFFKHLFFTMIVTIMMMFVDIYTSMQTSRYFLVMINTLILLYVIELIKLSLWGSK